MAAKATTEGSLIRGSLTQALLPQTGIAKDAMLVTGGAALTAICTQVSIPWQPVPFSLQTLAVAVAGLTLGARRAALSQIAYLGAGVAGLPVFAEGKFGPAVLLGPTGGYLLAFVLGAYLLGLAADRGLDRKPLPLFAVMATVITLTLGLGTLWLGNYLGSFQKAFPLGFAPFIAVEAMKMAAVSLTLPGIWSWVKGKS